MVLIRQGPKAAMVGFDDGPADRKAHSHAVRFRSEHRIKNAFDGVRINSSSSILDNDEQTIGCRKCGFYSQYPASILHPIHRLDSIHDQVQKHLLQLDSLADNRRE